MRLLDSGIISYLGNWVPYGVLGWYEPFKEAHTNHGGLALDFEQAWPSDVGFGGDDLPSPPFVYMNFLYYEFFMQKQYESFAQTYRYNQQQT